MNPLRALRRWWNGTAVPGSWGGPGAAVDTPACAVCAHFRDDPADMEAALPGLSVLSSGHASVRGRDGLCLRHDRFVTARSSCPLFEPRRV